MKAIILKNYEGLWGFEMVEIPLPPIEKGHLRIRIKAISFNPVDNDMAKRGFDDCRKSACILGRDLSGIVDEVHVDESDFKKGDEVFCYVSNLASSGTYTEYITVPSSIVAKKPVFLSHEQAASIPLAGITALLAIEKVKKKNFRSLLIGGATGGVGIFAVIFAKLSGFQNILVTAGNEKSRNYLKNKLHLKDEQIVCDEGDAFIDHAIKINGDYFGITLDLLGGKMLSACCKLLAVDGQLISVVESPCKDDFNILFQKNASFHSIGVDAFFNTGNPAQMKTYKYILNYISELFDSNVLFRPPIKILGSLNVETVQLGHELIKDNNEQGKLIMTC